MAVPQRRFAGVEHAQQQVAGLALVGACAAALRRVHTLVGLPQRIGDLGASAGIITDPLEAPTSNPSPSAVSAVLPAATSGPVSAGLISASTQNSSPPSR